MEILTQILPAGLLSFALFHFASRDELPMKHKLPKIKLKRLEISPNIRITAGKKVIHFHHWFNFAVLLALSVPIKNGFLDSNVTKSFLVGGMVQGLLTPNANRIIYNKDEAWTTFKTSYLDNRFFKTPIRLIKKPFQA